MEHRELREADLVAVEGQLGREPDTSFTVVARCTGGHPLVIRNAPFTRDGTPFPTTYWLTCPEASRLVSGLESEGWIRRLNERYELDAGFRREVDRAHAAAAAEREAADPAARGMGGVGGTAKGLKCLHAHYANHLAGADDPVGRWVAARIEPVHPEQRPGRVAAIDQGTNSCRLLVLEPGGPGDPQELARDMVITRLGQGVAESGVLDRAALGRTLAVLTRYCRRARALGAERIRVGATSAVRDATNREELASAVRELAGSELEVIDGSKEAELSFLGGTRGLKAEQGPFLLMDIGGGSTELVFGRRPGRAEASISTQMGSVRMTERFIRSDPPSVQDLEAVREEAGRTLEMARAKVSGDAESFVNVAGTATTIQAIALGLQRYDPDLTHRTWLSLRDAEGVLERLSAMTNAQRAAIPVMAPGRGDVIVAGGVILVEAMRRFGFDRTLVSETDILDGLALELLGLR